jgi:fructose-specific phosphotransferase system IIA component
MKISEILDPKCVFFNIKSKDKFEVISEMVYEVCSVNNLSEKDKIYNEVIKREKIMSTGVGKGIALPHAKTNFTKSIFAGLAMVEPSIDFESLDDEPVNIIFLLIGSDTNVGLHLRVLSKISRLMNSDSFRNQLLECTDSNEILDLFSKYEEKF